MADGSGSALSTWALNTLYAGGTLCAGALLLLYVFQEKLLYYPTIPGAPKLTKENPRGYRNPGEYGIDYEDLMISTRDGVRVHAWLIKQSELADCPTLVFFHGNAGNIGYRLPNAIQLYHKVGVNVVLVDYRGFGHSDGEPSESGIKLDAEAVLDALHARSDIDKTKIILFGRSLGGAVAVYLADKEPSRVSAVVLENTFLSISSMVDSLMPFLSYVKAIVLRMDWDSGAVISRIRQPILFVAGLRDELVPHSHMETLRSRATSSKKVVWYAVPNGTHNDTWLRGGDKYFAELRHFLALIGHNQDEATHEDTCAAPGEGLSGIGEGTIPSMLQQTLVGKVSKTSKPHSE